MRRFALLLPLLAACAQSPDAGERIAAAEQRFTSNEAVLLDFEFDGKLLTDTADPGALRSLIEAQLMYSVGHLNGDRSVGRHERLDLSAITATPSAIPDRFEVSYHAKLPVAWGAASKPSSYVLTLPARVGETDQLEFAAKYGVSCVEPSAGSVPAGRMFLFYRPHNAPCELAADDVVTLPVTVSPSLENTTAKYPEYDRIWDDGALDVVVMFSQAEATPTLEDEGIRAYEDFLSRAYVYLRGLAPVAPNKTSVAGATTFAATLSDGRAINLHVRLVGHDLAADGAPFDAWYDPLTPGADVILYNGHAGLGANVRTLMSKGTFRPAKYVIWSVNGCDTFAYVDRTLADRRGLLNADDPRGTKYMDTVSNVMAGYFSTSPKTSMTLIEAIVRARDPKPAPLTYREIFKAIDPEQVVAVTGEEDNEFEPHPVPAAVVPPPSNREPATTAPPESPPQSQSPPDETPEPRATSGCSAAPAGGGATSVLVPLVALGILVARRRRTPVR